MAMKAPPAKKTKPVKRFINPESGRCVLCGREYKNLARHMATRHKAMPPFRLRLGFYGRWLCSIFIMLATSMIILLLPIGDTAHLVISVIVGIGFMYYYIFAALANWPGDDDPLEPVKLSYPIMMLLLWTFGWSIESVIGRDLEGGVRLLEHSIRHQNLSAIRWRPIACMVFVPAMWIAGVTLWELGLLYRTKARGNRL